MTTFRRSDVAFLALAGLALLRASGGAEESGWQNWESDVTDSMGIGPTLEGYRRVGLRCAPDHMQVEVEMEDEFDGALYTRGAFHSQEEPCFLDARGGRNFTLSLPFTRCNTRNENNLYSNTLVIQYDDELIMPGDAAFTLECDFRKPKDYKVSADLDSNRIYSSRIILDDADPAAVGKPKEERMTAISDSDVVSFLPKRMTKITKDEL
ncbi:Cuticlin-1 [Frankliniella fusca]|uniref:Cuticlin-1 n=1 Tax=Frankliniella fusca TaxID=407009 RepID=A0AAE1LDK6_9NEOP|nr:Cuticlin-1 [Frankliniella fusca]